MLGKTEGRRKRGPHRMKWLDGMVDSMNVRLNKLWKTLKDKRSLKCCSPWSHKESDMA